MNRQTTLMKQPKSAHEKLMINGKPLLTLTVAELKDELKRRNCPLPPLKIKMIDRLAAMLEKDREKEIQRILREASEYDTAIDTEVEATSPALSERPSPSKSPAVASSKSSKASVSAPKTPARLEPSPSVSSKVSKLSKQAVQMARADQPELTSDESGSEQNSYQSCRSKTSHSSHASSSDSSSRSSSRSRSPSPPAQEISNSSQQGPKIQICYADGVYCPKKVHTFLNLETNKQQSAKSTKFCIRLAEPIRRIESAFSFTPSQGRFHVAGLAGTDRQSFDFTPFDAFFDDSASQEVLYSHLEAGLFDTVRAGKDIYLYGLGETGSGKAWTVFGTPAGPGICVRFCRELVALKRNGLKAGNVELRIYFFEVYRKSIFNIYTSRRIKSSQTHQTSWERLLKPELVKSVDDLNKLYLRYAESGRRKQSGRCHRVFHVEMVQRHTIASRDGTQISDRQHFRFIEMAGLEKYFDPKECDSALAAQSLAGSLQTYLNSRLEVEFGSSGVSADGRHSKNKLADKYEDPLWKLIRRGLVAESATSVVIGSVAPEPGNSQSLFLLHLLTHMSSIVSEYQKQRTDARSPGKGLSNCSGESLDKRPLGSTSSYVERRDRTGSDSRIDDKQESGQPGSTFSVGTEEPPKQELSSILEGTSKDPFENLEVEPEEPGPSKRPDQVHEVQATVISDEIVPLPSCPFVVELRSDPQKHKLIELGPNGRRFWSGEKDSQTGMMIYPNGQNLMIRAVNCDLLINHSRVLHADEYMQLEHGDAVALSKKRVFCIVSDSSRCADYEELLFPPDKARLAYMDMLLLTTENRLRGELENEQKIINDAEEMLEKDEWLLLGNAMQWNHRRASAVRRKIAEMRVMRMRVDSVEEEEKIDDELSKLEAEAPRYELLEKSIRELFVGEMRRETLAKLKSELSPIEREDFKRLQISVSTINNILDFMTLQKGSIFVVKSLKQVQQPLPEESLEEVEEPEVTPVVLLYKLEKQLSLELSTAEFATFSEALVQLHKTQKPPSHGNNPLTQLLTKLEQSHQCTCIITGEISIPTPPPQLPQTPNGHEKEERLVQVQNSDKIQLEKHLEQEQKQEEIQVKNPDQIQLEEGKKSEKAIRISMMQPQATSTPTKGRSPIQDAEFAEPRPAVVLPAPAPVVDRNVTSRRTSKLRDPRISLAPIAEISAIIPPAGSRDKRHFHVSPLEASPSSKRHCSSSISSAASPVKVPREPTNAPTPVKVSEKTNTEEDDQLVAVPAKRRRGRPPKTPARTPVKTPAKIGAGTKNRSAPRSAYKPLGATRSACKHTIAPSAFVHLDSSEIVIEDVASSPETNQMLLDLHFMQKDAVRSTSKPRGLQREVEEKVGKEELREWAKMFDERLHGTRAVASPIASPRSDGPRRRSRTLAETNKENQEQRDSLRRSRSVGPGVNRNGETNGENTNNDDEDEVKSQCSTGSQELETWLKKMNETKEKSQSPTGSDELERELRTLDAATQPMLYSERFDEHDLMLNHIKSKGLDRKKKQMAETRKNKPSSESCLLRPEFKHSFDWANKAVKKSRTGSKTGGKTNTVPAKAGTASTRSTAESSISDQNSKVSNSSVDELVLQPSGQGSMLERDGGSRSGASMKSEKSGSRRMGR